MMKNQEIKDLTKVFENEANKLKEVISIKDKMVDSLTSENNKEKARIVALTHDY